MPLDLRDVQPGEIISSDFFNKLLAEVRDIQQRILVLETAGSDTGSVQITQFVPAASVAMGNVLRIDGNNFAFPPQNNTVTIGGVQVADGQFRQATSSNTVIELNVPTNIPDVGINGRTLLVTVSNALGSSSRGYTILREPSQKVPTITAVIGQGGVSNRVIIGSQAQITGTNFSEDPIVTFQLGNENAVTAVILNSTPTSITLTVPDVPNIPPGPLGANVTLQVTTNAGAGQSAVLIVNMAR